jgi:hypothetical protein
VCLALIDTKAVKSRCVSNNRRKPDLLQLLDVILHGLLFGHVAQLLPGLPFLALDHLPEGWLRLSARAFGALLEVRVEFQLQVVGRLVRTLDTQRANVNSHLEL